jgi:hypothetical protein
MMGDPEQCHFRLWFLPESGNDPNAVVLGDGIVGWRQAAQVARQYMHEDFQEPDDYGQLYTDAYRLLEAWEQDPNKWTLAIPVHYGTLVLA